MKQFLNTILIAFLITACISSCDKKDNTVSYQSFESYLSSQPQLSTFAQALDKAQLQTFKSGQGPFTWFAPTNNAFIAAGITNDSLSRMTAGQLSYILLYHLINPTSVPLVPVTTKEMVAQSSFARASQLGQNFYLGNYKDSFYINGASLLSSNNNVSNGVVHVISSLNVPPNLRGNIQAILNTTGQHSLFIAALTKANRLAALGGTSVFTVLAPTDAAMTTAGLTSGAITAATVGFVDSLVRYHLFSGSRLFTNDFGNNLSPATILGSTRKIQASNFGRTLKGTGNSSAVNVITPNVLGTNGVVQIVDGVLRF